MRSVRWAQVALLAVAPACAHTSSGQVENASTVEATAGLPDSPAAIATADNSINTMGTRTRFTYLGTQQTVVAPQLSGQIVADAPTCDPWADDERARCTFEEAVSQRLR
jgi:hypothetical protein